MNDRYKISIRALIIGEKNIPNLAALNLLLDY